MSRSNKSYHRRTPPKKLTNLFQTRVERRLTDRGIRRQLERPDEDVIIVNRLPNGKAMWYWY